MAELRITVDRNKCTGEGVCVGIAPEVFELNDEGVAEVIELEGADRETIIEAGQGCPTEAITVIDEATGEQLAP